MISASDCLCDNEPQIFLCHGWKPRGDDENYISRFRSKDEYLKMSEEINGLHNSGLFFEDGSFARIEDALDFSMPTFNLVEEIGGSPLVSLQRRHQRNRLIMQK